MPPSVKIDAAKTNRSLVSQAPSSRPQLQANPHLLLWRKLIDSAVHDAKKTFAGIPTDRAIAARWWLEEFKPKQSERNEWERSFECACGWLGLDPAQERLRLLEDIDHELQIAYADHVRSVVYLRRAAVLTCAGVPTAVGRQYALPLVNELDFEDIAGVEHPEPERVVRQLHAREERKAKVSRLTTAA